MYEGVRTLDTYKLQHGMYMKGLSKGIYILN
jgi:hypothetical protein